MLWSAQGMDVPQIAPIAFTSEDRVREVVHNFNRDGVTSLEPRYAGGRPPKFTLPERPPEVRIAIVLDNFISHRSTQKDTRMSDWVETNNVELAYTPHYASWLNRIEAQFTALRPCESLPAT